MFTEGDVFIFLDGMMKDPELNARTHSSSSLMTVTRRRRKEDLVDPNHWRKQTDLLEPYPINAKTHSLILLSYVYFGI